MSLWTCSTHGLTGPAACCSKAVYCTNTGENAVTDAPRQDAPDARTRHALMSATMLQLLSIARAAKGDGDGRDWKRLEREVQSIVDMAFSNEAQYLAWRKRAEEAERDLLALRERVPSEPRYGKTYHDGAWTCGCGGPDGIRSKVLAVCDECGFLSPYLAPHAPEPVAFGVFMPDGLLTGTVRLTEAECVKWVSSGRAVHPKLCTIDALYRATPPQRAGVTEAALTEHPTFKLARRVLYESDPTMNYEQVACDLADHVLMLTHRASRVAPQGGET